MSKIASMEEKIEILQENEYDSSSEEEMDITEEPGVSEISTPEHSLFSVADSSINTDTETDLSDSELSSGDEEESEPIK